MPKISNIDAIIELILREARARSRWDNYTNIFTVKRDINKRIDKILSDIKEEERRKKKDESNDKIK